MKSLNFTVTWREKTKFYNADFLPNSIRALLIGSSNCCKTTLLFRLLLTTNVLDYNSLFIFSKSLNQKEYQLIVEGFRHKLTKEHIRGIFENQEEFKDLPTKDICFEIGRNLKAEGDITVSAFSSGNSVPDPAMLDSNKKNLMIFDDVILESQKIIESYYT